MIFHPKRPAERSEAGCVVGRLRVNCAGWVGCVGTPAPPKPPAAKACPPRRELPPKPPAARVTRRAGRGAEGGGAGVLGRREVLKPSLTWGKGEDPRNTLRGRARRPLFTIVIYICKLLLYIRKSRKPLRGAGSQHTRRPFSALPAARPLREGFCASLAGSRKPRSEGACAAEAACGEGLPTTARAPADAACGEGYPKGGKGSRGGRREKAPKRRGWRLKDKLAQMPKPV